MTFDMIRAVTQFVLVVILVRALLRRGHAPASARDVLYAVVVVMLVVILATDPYLRLPLREMGEEGP